MKKYFTSILLVTSAFVSNAQAPSLDWAGQVASTVNSFVTSMTTDANGNVYTTGNFSGIADFDPSGAVFSLTSQNYNGFVQKLDANGALVWAKQITGASDILPIAIALDNNGNVYMTGSFRGTVDFDPSGAVLELTSAGNNDVFVEKLDSNGDLLWVKQVGGTADDEPMALTIDANANIYVGGYFTDIVDFDPGAGVQSLTSNGVADMFIQKLDSNGDFVWGKQIGGLGWDFITSMDVAQSGNLYVIGHYAQTTDLDPGVGVQNFTAAGQSAVFIEKLDANGDFVWAKHLTGYISTDYTDWSYATIDEDENIIITGSLHGTIDLDPGAGVYDLTSSGFNSAFFVEKLNTNGDFIWAKSIGGMSAYANSIVTDSDGSVYFTGGFQGTVDFDPSASTFDLTSNGNMDIYFQKLDANGAFAWVQHIGGIQADWGTAISLDSADDILLTANFTATVDVNPGAGVMNFTSTTGYEDHFILKLDNCIATFNSITIDNCFSYTVPSGNQTYTMSGIYNDTLTNACGSDSILIIDLTINTIDVSVTNSDPTLTAVATGATYQWIDCDNGNAAIASATNQWFTPTANGNYAVIVTENGCSDTSSCAMVASVNLEALNFGSEITVYPNPTSQSLTLDFGKMHDQILVEIVNPLGQINASKKYESMEKVTLELTGTSGVYYVIIQSEEGRAIKKVIKN